MPEDNQTWTLSKDAQSIIRSTSVNIKAAKAVHPSFVHEQQKTLNHRYSIGFAESARLIRGYLVAIEADPELVEQFEKTFIG